ncbi:MAG: transglutaminase family protein [Moraxellaceae bacterium]|nr:transglutaminase family protein [Moraxellaceae bacterium]
MILTINHETVYRYDAAVAHSTQYLRLTPQNGEGQRVLEWKLELPSPATAGSDAFGNVLHVLTLDMPHSEIRIRATGIVETEAGDRICDSDGDPRPFLRATQLTSMDAAMMAFAEDYSEWPMGLEALDALSSAVAAHLPFTPGVTHVASTAAEAFMAASGVCQDHTHVFLACARYLGVPARYVSGYVNSPGHAEGHMASHAWAEVFVEGQWHGIDIVNRCHAGEHHLKLAVGMDYLDACPVRGMRRGGGGELMLAEVQVMAQQSAPRTAAEQAEFVRQQQQQGQQQ